MAMVLMSILAQVGQMRLMADCCSQPYPPSPTQHDPHGPDDPFRTINNNNNITEILKYVPWAREGGCYSNTIMRDPKSHSSPGHQRVPQ
jgi:hypothetical protein